jgi:hypothetical protein
MQLQHNFQDCYSFPQALHKASNGFSWLITAARASRQFTKRSTRD